MAERYFSETWLSKLGVALEYLGHEPFQVFSRVTLAREDVRGGAAAQARVSHGNHRELWAAIEEVSGDTDIGLHLGEVINYSSGELLQYLFLSSATFGEAVTRSARYSRLLSDAMSIHCAPDGDRINFGFHFSHGRPVDLRHLNELMMVSLARFFDYVTSGNCRLLRVEFNHPAPASTSEHRRVFGLEPVFGAEANTMVLPGKLWDLESLHAEPAMLRLHEQLLMERMSELEQQDILLQVQEAIGALLDHQEVSLEGVAQRLGITPGKLRYQLSDLGTSFNQLFVDYRVSLARRLLAETEEPIEQVVYLTGFSEPSPFYRAFRRWTGMTPAGYRQKYGRRTGSTGGDVTPVSG